MYHRTQSVLQWEDVVLLIKFSVKRIPEICQTRKHQESVSPSRQQLHWQNLSDKTIFGTLEFAEGLQLPEEDQDGKLWLTQVNFSSWYSTSNPFPTPRHLAGSCAHVSGAAAHSLWESGWAKRTLFSKQWRTVLSLLIAASNHRGG